MDWIINLIGIGVNGILAWWIVHNIQKKQNNERAIKDHFICEIKNLRADCSNFLNSVYRGKRMHKDIIPSLKLLGIKSSNLLNILKLKFDADEKYFNSYFLEMNRIITDDDNYISCLSQNTPINLTSESHNLLLKFQSDHNFKFNELILIINEG